MICKLKENANHCNLKERVLYPDKFPTLKKGSLVKIVKQFKNYRGHLVKVLPMGCSYFYYIKPHLIEMGDK